METLKLARSMAGHDKNQLYVIVREEADAVYLADGVYRLMAKPKRKNRKHVQVITHLPVNVANLLAASCVRDLEIKRALKLYQRDI